MAGRGSRYFMLRRKADANQKAIVEALEAVGARIYDLSACGAGIPDIAVLKPNKRDVLFMEIKTAKGALRDSQIEAHEGWPVVVVRTIDEALAAVGVRA